MSINKERIRQKLQNITTRGGATTYWSPPKQGKAVIRMFPYPHGDDPFLEYFYHFNIGKQSILCPRKNALGNECPICDLAQEMYQSESSQDKEISKKLYARQRFYATIIDRADETKTPKFWGFSQTIYIKLLEWLGEDNGDRENFLDVHDGLDLVISMQKTPGKAFPSAEVDTKMKSSPLADNDADIQAIIKGVKPANEIFTVLSTQEIQQKLNEWANAEEDSAPEQVVDEVKENTVVKGKDRPKRSAAKSVEEVFAEHWPE